MLVFGSRVRAEAIWVGSCVPAVAAVRCPDVSVRAVAVAPTGGVFAAASTSCSSVSARLLAGRRHIREIRGLHLVVRHVLGLRGQNRLVRGLRQAAGLRLRIDELTADACCPDTTTSSRRSAGRRVFQGIEARRRLTASGAAPK